MFFLSPSLSLSLHLFYYFKVFTLKLLSAFALRGFKDLQGVIFINNNITILVSYSHPLYQRLLTPIENLPTQS